jgi:hypothetical protein
VRDGTTHDSRRHQKILNKVNSISYHCASPTRRTKLATIRDLLVRHTKEIGCFGVHRITPPLLNGVQSDRSILRILQGEEDDDNTNAITSI